VIPPGLALVYYTANNLKCNIIEFMREIVTVLLLAALPISELRGAIPVAMGVYGFDPISSYLLGVVGNLLPVPILLKLLGPATDLLRRSAMLNRVVGWLLARTRARHSALIARFGGGGAGALCGDSSAGNGRVDRGADRARLWDSVQICVSADRAGGEPRRGPGDAGDAGNN
jgi:hypothetical protein